MECCLNCGATYDEGIICPNCGSAMSRTVNSVRCENCRTIIKSVTRVCPNCKKPIMNIRINKPSTYPTDPEEIEDEGIGRRIGFSAGLSALPVIEDSKNEAVKRGYYHGLWIRITIAAIALIIFFGVMIYIMVGLIIDIQSK